MSSACGRIRGCRRCSRSKPRPRNWSTGLSHVLRVERVATRRSRRLADKVWEREWLRDFHPMCFGRRLWVAPHHAHVHRMTRWWCKLDPGLAFGTGTHATTAMCLAWLDETRPPRPGQGQLAIDYGCGSGVLAVAAVKLGAREAHAFDIDPQALTATRDNAAANDVERERPCGGQRTPRCPSAPTCCWLTSSAARYASSRRASPSCCAPAARSVLAGLLSSAGRRGDHRRMHRGSTSSPFASRDGWTALDRRRSIAAVGIDRLAAHNGAVLMFTVCPKCTLTLVVTTVDLRAGQGYVRCGRCANVFNALIALREGEPGRQPAGHSARSTSCRRTRRPLPAER